MSELLDLLSADRCLVNFMRHVAVCEVTGCWVWTGGRSRGGERPHSGPYGTFNIPGLRGGKRAHVVMAAIVGIIEGLKVPEGFNLDHICENTLCVSPWHLELVTEEENKRRYNEGRSNLTYAERFSLRGIIPLTKEMERWLD
jgi:hypothetical protein